MSYVKDFMREALRDHLLTALDFIDTTPIFKLHDPTCRTHTFTLIVAEHGVTLVNDLHIGGDPELYAYTGRAKALEWITSDLSEEELCRKFLKLGWQPEAAARWCAERMGDILSGRHSGDLDGLTAIRRRLIAYEIQDGGYFSRELAGIGMAQSETPGVGFPPVDAGWLCAVHERFLELFRELLSRKATRRLGVGKR